MAQKSLESSHQRMGGYLAGRRRSFLSTPYTFAVGMIVHAPNRGCNEQILIASQKGVTPKALFTCNEARAPHWNELISKPPKRTPHSHCLSYLRNLARKKRALAHTLHETAHLWFSRELGSRTASCFPCLQIAAIFTEAPLWHALWFRINSSCCWRQCHAGGERV